MTTDAGTAPASTTSPPGWSGSAAAALATGPLLVLSSGLQLVTDVQRSDGEVLEPVLFTGLTALWTAGMLCLAVAVIGLSAGHQRAGLDLGRRGRVGGRLVLAGAGLQVLFAVSGTVTALLDGAPAEAAFLLFALGFLALVVGGLLLGGRVRRARLVPGTGIALQAGALLALLAILVGVDPWHDIALFGYDLSWSVVGLVMLGGRPGEVVRGTRGTLARPAVPRRARRPRA
jgi:hypothetical protein